MAFRGFDETHQIFSPQYDARILLFLFQELVSSSKLTSSKLKLLDTDDSLHFSLLRLQLIELIRATTSDTSANASSPEISTALEFATTHLAPLAPTNPSFLADLERTMALLIFPSNDLAPELAELIDPNLRKTIADRVNEAILASQGARREALIRKLVRMRAWSEAQARDSEKIKLPENGLPFGLYERPSMNSAQPERNGNGIADSQVTGQGDQDITMREDNQDHQDRDDMVS